MATYAPKLRNQLTQHCAVSQISVRQSEPEANYLFLIGYTVTAALSSMQFTLATCQVGTVAGALQY